VNKALVIVPVASLVLLGLVVATRLAKPAKQPAAERGTGAMMVDDLKRPGRLSGSIKVLGVVSGTDRDRARFALVDKREAVTCGAAAFDGCAGFQLPVSWNGSMPRVGQELVVKGRIENTTEGLVFVASEVTSP